MGIGILEVVGGLAALLFGGYYYFTSTFNFWRSRGVVGPKPIPLYGNFKDIMFGKISIPDFVRREYEKYSDEPLIGVFASRQPILIINDAELIKEVLIKHFSSFANRGIPIFEKIEPLTANLVNLEAKRWRPLRAKQTTMFTTVKLREMFYLMKQCADHLDKTLDEMVKADHIIECAELTSRFSTDVIGACVFGIDMKALDDENSDFRRVGRKFIYADKWRAFKIRLKTICPALFTLLGYFMYDHEINDFFIKSMIDTMDERKKNNIRRGDFVDLLVDLRDHPDKLDIELTDSLLTAQAFAFFFAGFETSSTTMSNTLYELALNPDIQNKLRDEINDEIAKNNGILEYSIIENMKYLQQVISESLRKYPIVALLVRQAMEDHTFTSHQLSIPKDTRVWIPVYGIHRNPKIYPNPDVFDPERFTEENIKERHPSYYLPFGAGPRNCIGARFGSMQTKTGLITILRRYKIEVCEKTAIPYVTHRRRFLLGPADGVHLKFTRLE